MSDDSDHHRCSIDKVQCFESRQDILNIAFNRYMCGKKKIGVAAFRRTLYHGLNGDMVFIEEFRDLCEDPCPVNDMQAQVVF